MAASSGFFGLVAVCLGEAVVLLFPDTAAINFAAKDNGELVTLGAEAGATVAAGFGAEETDHFVSVFQIRIATPFLSLPSTYQLAFPAVYASIAERTSSS